MTASHRGPNGRRSTLGRSGDALAASVAANQAAEERRRNGLMFYQALVEGWAISGQGGLQDYIVSGFAAEDPGQLIQAAQPKIYLRDGVDGLLEWSEEIMQAATETGPRNESVSLCRADRRLS